MLALGRNALVRRAAISTNTKLADDVGSKRYHPREERVIYLNDSSKARLRTVLDRPELVLPNDDRRLHLYTCFWGRRRPVFAFSGRRP